MPRTSSWLVWAVAGISGVLSFLWWNNRRPPTTPAREPVQDSVQATATATEQPINRQEQRESGRELAQLRDAVTTLRAANASLSNEVTLLRAELARLKTASVVTPRLAEPSDIVIGRGIGTVMLGMTVEQLRQDSGAPSHEIGPDPRGNTALVYTNLGLSPVVSNGVVIAIQAGTNFQGRTQHGIGVGSARSTVWAALGQPYSTLDSTDGSVEDTYPGMRIRFGPDGAANHFLIRPLN